MLNRLIVSAALVVGTSLTSPAAAQSVTSLRPDVGTVGLPDSGNQDDWRRCINEERRYTLETAIESCDRLLADRLGHIDVGAAYWHRAMRYQDAEQFDQASENLALAAASYEAAIEANPRRPAGYSRRAAVLARLGRFDEALADYDRAAALSSNVSAPWLGRGSILFRRGDYAGASDAYDRAARIAARTDATHSGHHSARCAVRAASRSDLERGLGFCNRAVRNADAPSYALTARGFFWFRQGDLDAAAADFARAAEEDPYNASAIYGRGVVAVRQGRTEEGEADMSRGLSMDRYEVEFYANAGLRP